MPCFQYIPSVIVQFNLFCTINHYLPFILNTNITLHLIRNYDESIVPKHLKRIMGNLKSHHAQYLSRIKRTYIYKLPYFRYFLRYNAIHNILCYQMQR